MSATFGVRGTSHAAQLLAIAQRDLLEARIAYRSVSSTVLMHYWQGVIEHARRRAAAWAEVVKLGEEL